MNGREGVYDGLAKNRNRERSSVHGVDLTFLWARSMKRVLRSTALPRPAKRTRRDEVVSIELPIELWVYEVGKWLSLRDLMCGLARCSRALAAQCPLGLQALYWPALNIDADRQLARFGRLTDLYLHSGPAVSDAGIMALNHLTCLYYDPKAVEPRLTDRGLATLTKLRHLSIDGGKDECRFSGACLTALVKLEKLTIHWNRIDDDYVLPLASQSHLTHLALSSITISGHALAALTQLQRLELYDDTFAIMALPRLTNLTWLELRPATSSIDPNCLRDLVALMHVDIAWASLARVPVLTRLTNLTWLSLYQTTWPPDEALDLFALAQLRFLNLETQAPVRVDTLVGCTALQTLVLHLVPINEHVLLQLTNLTSLDIREGILSER
jgi:hypothetical protein